MQEKESEGFKHEKPKKKKLIAKKDWVLKHNDFLLNIKEGDDLSKSVKDNKLLECLKREQVI